MCLRVTKCGNATAWKSEVEIKTNKTMAKYIEALKRNNIALVPGNKVNRVCNAAEKQGMTVLGGAMQKTPKGVYQWLYIEKAA